MPRTVPAPRQHDLERAMVCRSVGALTEPQTKCRDCGRTPLIGETVYRFARETVVCELCRPLRRDEPEACELVRHNEAGLTVRVLRASEH